MIHRCLPALALAILALPAAANTGDPRPLIEQGVRDCLRFRNSTGESLPAPKNFTPDMRGRWSAEAGGVSIMLQGQREEDPDLETIHGRCEVGIRGEMDWFAYFANELTKSLQGQGWDIVAHESGLAGDTMVTTLAGQGRIQIAFGVNKPNAIFAISWAE